MKNKEKNSLARNLQSLSYSFTPKVVDQVLDQQTFYLDYKNLDDNIRATCRYVSPEINGITLSVWVADNSWYEGGTKSKLVDGTMVQLLAEKFLRSGDDNDIYDWVTSLYGKPWGSAASLDLGLLPDTESNKIAILLYDIDDDGTNGGLLGYYWSKDNFVKEAVAGSNERLMFYIDAEYLATEDSDVSDGWSLSDRNPEKIVSTLGHEFQHMIHFYQKQVIQNVDYSDTWLNEMCSVITEDIIAEKCGVAGPRGFSGAYAGDPWITDGRLPVFNACDDDSLVNWQNGSSIGYSSVYAFGAFLARNYGGAELFQKIVQNNQTDEQAVLSALSALGYSKTLKQLLIEWGQSVLTSEQADSGYNKSESSLGYTEYPINLNYYRIDVGGWTLKEPKIYNGNISNIMPSENPPPASNTYYRAGYNLTGTQSWKVEIPNGITLTVVQKDSK